MTEQDIQQIKLIIQAEAENLACMFGEGLINNDAYVCRNQKQRLGAFGHLFLYNLYK